MKFKPGYLILLIALFWLCTTRQGTSWGDDWAMYVHQAQNIAEGKSYNHNLFIYNPNYLTYSPKTYPPGFPVLLLPFYACFGLNIAALKIPGILSFIAALFIFCSLYKKQLGPAYTACCLLVLGFSPFFWDSKDYILSDMPFLLTVMLAVWVMDKSNRATHNKTLWYLLAGAAIYISFSVRSLGLLFIPAMLGFDILFRHRLSKGSAITTVAFVLLVIIQMQFIPADDSYGTMLKAHYSGKSAEQLWSFFANYFGMYQKEFADFWLQNHNDTGIKNTAAIYNTAFLIVSGLAIVYRLVKQPDATALFVLIYTLAVLLFPGYQGPRYFIPLVPFLLFYVLWLIKNIPFRGIKYAFSPIVIVPLIVFYTYYFTHANWNNIDYGIHEPNPQRLMNYIKQNTPPDAVFVLCKPRVLALYTGRAAAVYHYAENKNDLLNYMQTINAGYAVSNINWDPYFNDWTAADTAHFKPILNSGGLMLYKVSYNAAPPQ